MLVHGQELHARKGKILFHQRGNFGGSVSVHFGDDHQLPARLEHSQDLTHTGGQVRPPEMRFHGRNQVEYVIGKGKAGDRSFNDLDAPCCDLFFVGLAGHGDALPGIVNAIDLPLSRQRGQLVHSPAATAAYVKNGLVFFYGDMRQAPIRDLGMARIHVSENKSPKSSCGLLTLIDASNADQQVSLLWRDYAKSANWLRQ